MADYQVIVQQATHMRRELLVLQGQHETLTQDCKEYQGLLLEKQVKIDGQYEDEIFLELFL